MSGMNVNEEVEYTQKIWVWENLWMWEKKIVDEEISHL